jgi:hypothetical protein
VKYVEQKQIAKLPVSFLLLLFLCEEKATNEILLTNLKEQEGCYLFYILEVWVEEKKTRILENFWGHGKV